MRWQYRILKIGIGGFLGPQTDMDKLEGVLDQLGQEGWELVSVEDTSMQRGVSDDLLLFFKRPREQ
jgi:hypothetical protein